MTVTSASETPHPGSAPAVRVDLRSDTLTRPTRAMRQAMAAAEVGDDVYGEDPTVNRLEREVAELFGHEGALLVPSGTMGNLIALACSAERGTEVLADEGAHIVTYELGGLAALAGVQTRTVTGPAGLLSPETVTRAIRPPGWGTVATRVVALEQTHNRGGGSVYPLETLRTLREVAVGNGARLHCDGARIWNAAIATGTPLSDYGALFDTLSVCLSKGLGAPVGSLVVGDMRTIVAARDLRKRLGGGMRQAGVLAAAGLVAIHDHVGRLAGDHDRARRLAATLGAAVPETNIVVLTVPDAPAFASAARVAGIGVGAMGPSTVRLVTHLDVDDAAIDDAAVTLGRLLETAQV